MTSDTTHTLAAALAALMCFTLFFRFYWVVWQQERWFLLAYYWAASGAQTPENAGLAIKTIRPIHIVFEAWRWDWSRYVAYPGLFDGLRTWADGELSKPRLTLEDLIQRAADASEAQPPVPPGAGDQGTS